MAYFDALASAIFKKDDEGRDLFYPWGVFGSGYIIEDKDLKHKIKKLVIQYYMLSFIMIIPGVLIAQNFFRISYIALSLFALLLLALVLYYAIKISHLTKGLSKTDIKLSMKDGWKATAVRVSSSFLWFGLFAMILVAIMGLALFFFEAPLFYTGFLLLPIGIAGSYAYNLMITFRKEALAKGEIKEEKSPVPTNKVVWNIRNIMLIVSLILIVLLSLSYVYSDSKTQYDIRMSKYENMSVEQMARYLADENAQAGQIDSITKHTGTDVHNAQMILYRELEMDEEEELLFRLNEPDLEKERMKKQLKRQMCTPPTYKLFYEKGGELLFVYSRTQGNENSYLFNVKINAKVCGFQRKPSFT